MIPGFNGTITGGGGSAPEGVCADECTVDDPIAEFTFSSNFDGQLTDEDEVESALGFDSEADCRGAWRSEFVQH